MLPKVIPIALFVVAGAFALLGSPFAVAEPAAPEAVTPPQQGTGKRPLTKSDGAAFDAMRMHLMNLWNPPAPDDTTSPEELVVRVRFSLNPDATLAGPPKVMTYAKTERQLKAREAAVLAIFRGQPFTMLLSANYEWWKEVEITFDPRNMWKR